MNKLIRYIKSLESKLFSGYHLTIFKGYKASDKTGACKIIDDLYSDLGEEIEKAKKKFNR